MVSQMAVKTCRGTCTDSRGIAHSVEVTAQTLYEAVAKGLKIFRENDWSEDSARIPSVLCSYQRTGNRAHSAYERFRALARITGKKSQRDIPENQNSNDSERVNTVPSSTRTRLGGLIADRNDF